MNRRMWLVVFAIVLNGAGFASSAQASHFRVVNCDKGDSIARAVRKARAGQTILVKGVCGEQIHIKRDRIKIIGKDGAGFDGENLDPSNFEFNPMIRVTDAVGVVIRNLFVRNGPAEGLLVEGKSTVTLENVSAQENSNVGMLVDHARVEVTGGNYDGNQAGIDTTNGASAILRGDISLQNNIIFGIAASAGAALEARGTTMNASGNQIAGVLLEGGYLSIFNFGVSQGSQILADNNGACGFVLVGGGYLDIVAPPPLHFTGVNLLSAQNNQGCGFLMTSGGKIESPFGAATIQIEGNPAGMQISGNSDVSINGGLNIVNNFGPGLVADGAGLIALAPADLSPPPDLPSLIQNNGGPDVILNFGSRFIYESNAIIGSIACDGTALVRGLTVCP